jgi:hypothetical protein
MYLCIVVLCPFGISWLHRNKEFLFGVHPVFNFIFFYIYIFVFVTRYKQINVYGTLKHNYKYSSPLLQKFWRASFIIFLQYHVLLNLVYFVYFWGFFFLNKYYPRRILVTLLGKDVWIGYCEILITHQNREILKNVGSTTVTLLNYMCREEA